MNLDLEEEFMDLVSNELAYMPSSTASSPPRRFLIPLTSSALTSTLVQQVAQQLLAQATQQVALQQQHNQISPKPVASSSDEEQLSPEQLKFLTEEDARLDRRNAVVRELTAMRHTAVARRLDELVLQLEQLQQRITDKIGASDDTGDENERCRRLETQQMTAKLNFVVEQSALERQRVDEDVKWTRLLEELPMEERDYLGRAADEKFVEQMKYLRGERESERQDSIQRHLHGILVLTAPHRNGQTVAKTSMHHSLRHLLEAFANIFRGCYSDFLQYGGQGFGVFVLFKYPFLQTSEAQRNAVQRSVVAALFDALQPVLHGLDTTIQSAELRSSPEQLNVSMDDLCALLSFILISTPSSCLHVFTQLALLGSFAPQSVANGREGFALATCTTAVHHLMQLR
ncbi:hypothetical protein PI124_g22057 [Phytophthora idaei]|nr:hypothetical protein PI125_g23890 [Phytophthora idaei]KAG3127348.1 hypothetical protein PI126_g21894 [Phytophthora idaei]KAG3232868.1 hypothetical protein PI124_g22057 [Phytophthora idaei]